MSESKTMSVEAVSEAVPNPTESQNEPQQTKAEPTADNVQQEASKSDEKAEVTEEKPETKPEPPKDRFASKFAALSRKEKVLRQKEQELESKLKSKESELQTRIKELEERESRYKTREQLKKEKPLQFIEEEGLSYDELTQAILNNGEVPAEKKQEQVIASLQTEIQKLAARLEEKEKKEQDEKEEAAKRSTEEKYQTTVNNFKGDIKSTLSKAPVDDFELLMSGLFADVTDPVEAVYDVIVEHYEKTKAESPDQVGEVMDIIQAAGLVEKWLESEAEKLAKTKKLKSKLLPPTTVTKEEPKQSKAPSESPKTLENAHSSTVPNRQGRKLTDDELIAEAASMIRWNKT
jgi:hypothetical protein